MPNKQVSDKRKTIYYVGMIIGGIGALMFLSAFLTIVVGMGATSQASMQTAGQTFAFLGVGGFVCIVVGGTISNIGKQGLAGSGIVLDPEKAREEVEPWSRMQGGILKDTLDEAGVDLGFLGKSSDSSTPELPFDEKLRRLHSLFEDGILSEEEYLREKQQLLDNN